MDDNDMTTELLTTAVGCSFLIQRSYSDWLEDILEIGAFLADCDSRWLADVIWSARYAAAVRPCWN